MQDRLSSLTTLLNEQGLDGILISDASNILYLSGYTGFSEIEREGYIFITKRASYILTSPLHATAVKKKVTDMHVLELSTEKHLKEWLATLVQKHNIQILGIQDSDLTVHEYKQIGSLVKKKSADISSLRSHKSPTEILYIQKACRIGDLAFTNILSEIKPGMAEEDIAQTLELFIREKGASLSFRTIVAFNDNAAVPHHMTDRTKLGKNALILMDFGVKYENYCSDMTRTVFLGKPADEQRKIYETVRIAQRNAAEYISENLQKKQAVKLSAPDNLAREYIMSQGFPNFPHTLGHGIGIEVHEPYRLSPYATEYFQEGMAFSIEPGIYLPGNCGVRIEDLYAIQNGKLEQLTHAPKELVSI